MSDTPMEDAKTKFYRLNPEKKEEFPAVDFARSRTCRLIERENAALRHSEESLASTVRGLEFELEKAQKKVVALRQDKERLLKVIEDLESLARPAMREANMCGAGYDIDEELREARLIIDAARAKEGGAT